MELFEPSPELMMNLINAYAKEQRYQETVNTALTLIKVSPSANAYERLGWGYFRLGQFEPSIEAYREGVRLDPTHWMSLNGIGVNALNTWLKSGKTDESARIEARTTFRKSLQVNPGQPKVATLMTSYGL
jgi:tetratricopeptide (TPR) repeat protein